MNVLFDMLSSFTRKEKKDVNEKKYYELMLNNGKKTGVLYAPPGTDTLWCRECYPVIGYEDMVFTLKDGEYAPYMISNVCCYLADEDLKQLIEEVIPEGYPLELLPVRVTSEEYGDKTYYLIHFTELLDVIDRKHSKCIPGTKAIAVPRVDHEKAKKLDFFNCDVRHQYFFVSDRMRKMMKKRKLDKSIRFIER